MTCFAMLTDIPSVIANLDYFACDAHLTALAGNLASLTSNFACSLTILTTVARLTCFTTLTYIPTVSTDLNCLAFNTSLTASITALASYLARLLAGITLAILTFNASSTPSIATFTAIAGLTTIDIIAKITRATLATATLTHLAC
ncbi:MAG: hypothetical protein ACQCN4_13690 [Candidatus Bathyarchaeia archaeon]